MSTSTDEPLLNPELLARLEQLELVTRKIFRGRLKGERRGPRKGQSVEFADFRGYSPGDDLRRIDWNLYARLDRLFLKLFLEEEDLHFYALIDDSRSMDFGQPTKLTFAKKLAAALGFVGLVRGDRVKIETLSATGPAFRGRASLYPMLDRLEAIKAEGKTSLAQGVRNFCLRNRGKGIVILLSDLMDKHGYEEALRYLVARQMDAYVVHVLSREELEPDIKGDLKLIDCEDSDIAEVTVSGPLLKRYEQTLAKFVEGAKSHCSRRGMSYILANNQMPVDRLVMTYLRERGLVR